MQRWVRPVLAPAMEAMRRMRLPVKLGLMGLLVTLPLLLLALAQVRTLGEAHALADSERDGARVIGDWLALSQALQSHRAVLMRRLSGDAGAEPELQEERRRLAGQVGALRAQDGAALEFDLPEGGPALLDRAAAIAEGRHAPQRDQAFAEHMALVTAIDRHVFAVAEHSRLLLDPEAGTYFAMDIVVNPLGRYLEAVSVLHGRGLALLARGEASARERMLVLNAAADLQGLGTAIEDRFGALQRAGATVPEAWPVARDAAAAFATRAVEAFTRDVLDAEAGPFDREGRAAQQAVGALAGALIGGLQQDLAARAEAKQRELWFQMALAAGATALVAWLALAFYFSFYGALSALHKGVARVVAGDLSQRIEIRGRDEMAEIGSLVETMNQRLSAMVAEIRSSAVRVGLSGHEVARGSTALAQRTEQQAASLQQTLLSAQSLSTAVSSNAAEAAELDRAAQGLRTEAEAGGAAMRETVEAMSHLQEGSKRVAEIIGVIDAIAFQTNILALNAAVEAARAGEAGRGFAVVAAEVRQLAQRSAAAAGEIRTLIQRSGEQVQSSVERIHHVGQVLETLVAGVRRSSESLRGIAEASAAQSRELQQVARAVGDLDGVTRENATLVTVSDQASRDLVARAERLSRAVSTIRLRQGSADEAKALVDRALPLLRDKGLAGAAAELHSTAAGFVDRDLYVFVVDDEGTYRLHGAKPAMEGHRVHELPGIDGDAFVAGCRAAAARAGGWVEYEIVNPATGEVMPKASYVVGWNGQFVGCGVYRTEPATA